MEKTSNWLQESTEVEQTKQAAFLPLTPRCFGWYTVAIERVRIADASVETIWTAPDDMLVAGVVAVPGTDDFIVFHQQEESDAWLMSR